MSQSLHFSCDQSTLNAHEIEHIINFQVYFDCTEGLGYKIRTNSYGVYVFKKKTWWGVFPSLRKGYVILLTHTPTISNQIILIN